LDPAHDRDIRMHRIDADDAFRDLSASSKVNAEWAFLEYLRDLGRSAADDWLEANFDAVGTKPTVDLSGELSPGLRPAAERGLGARVKRFLETHRRPAA
ncbi:MAG: patatin-like phospholipase family protein, partial [Mesorhizobium sp.]|nr:patatin-like phospholipase family protein [Mesorhizobium sp.]